MPLSEKEITKLIKETIPDAIVEIKDLMGDNNHYSAKIKSKVFSFQTPKGRCQVTKINGITIIDDTYNANLNSSLAALDYLNTFNGDGRKLFVFGDMLELGEKSIEQHKLIGEKCESLKLDYIFTIGKHSANTSTSFK